jgi:hypothetical protein
MAIRSADNSFAMFVVEDEALLRMMRSKCWRDGQSHLRRGRPDRAGLS